MKRASVFDFITIDLTSPEIWRTNIGMEYFIYSRRKDEYHRFVVTEATTYEYLKNYIKKGLVYVKEN